MGIQFKSTKEYFIIESDQEEDFIDMEILSSPSTLYNNNNKEFEFQLMPSFNDQHNKASNFPADELFYKGKLLPLHLPPRLQMVQTILHQTNNNNINSHKITSSSSSSSPSSSFSTIKLCPQQQEHDHFLDFEQVFSQPNTPTDQSCNISPSESCRVSCDELFDHGQWSTTTTTTTTTTTSHVTVRSKKSSWSTKLKHSSLGKKLIKVSRSYLKHFLLFPHNNISKSSASNTRTDHLKKSTSLGESENEINIYRKSFSGVVQRNNFCSSSTSSFGINSNSSSGSSSSSSSFSLNSSTSCYYDLQWLKRCSSSSFELETPIDGAIAHCKQSSSQHHSFFTASASKNILVV